ncbi:MAG: apolipoprotein N-acyltransferase [Spirochaetales bacterium]|nr:apolipoprotein N-acyltransferase [Spirochaetales bacterium]
MKFLPIKTGVQNIVIKHMFLLAISAVLFALAFPGFLFVDGLGPAGFFALAPLFYVLIESKTRYLLLYSLFFSLIYSFTLFFWLINFNQYSIHITILFLWIYFFILFNLMVYINSTFRGVWPVVFPFIWVCFEYLRTVGFLGYPYGILGYSQYENIFLLQSASIYGVFGVSFFLASFSSFCILLYQYLSKKHICIIHISRRFNFLHNPKFSPWKIAYFAMILPLFGILFPLLGRISLNSYNSSLDNGSKTLKVAMIQHDKDSWAGGLETYKRNFELLRQLSQDVLIEDPDLLVWSETAFVPGYLWHTNYSTHWESALLVKEFQEFADSLDCYFVTGNSNGHLADPELPPILDNGKLNRKDYNSALFFKSGQLLDLYNKQRLVPFSEHLPSSFFSEKIAEKASEKGLRYWEKGDSYNLFDMGGLKFGPQICYEDCFDDISRVATNKGALFFLNLTNDRWAGFEAAYRFHQSFSVFRAVENRRPFLRATNSGVTCLISPEGRVVAELLPNSSHWLVVELELADAKIPFYSKNGNWFVILSFFISFFILGFSIVCSIIKLFKGKN